MFVADVLHPANRFAGLTAEPVHVVRAVLSCSAIAERSYGVAVASGVRLGVGVGVELVEAFTVSLLVAVGVGVALGDGFGVRVGVAFEVGVLLLVGVAVADRKFMRTSLLIAVSCPRLSIAETT